MHPDFVTHYYLADKQPFLNLSDLEGDELKKVIDELERKRSEEEGFHRVYGGYEKTSEGHSQ